MAVFLSKRLLRLVVFVGICLGILALMSPRAGEHLQFPFANYGIPRLDASKLLSSETSESDDVPAGEEELEGESYGKGEEKEGSTSDSDEYEDYDLPSVGEYGDKTVSQSGSSSLPVGRDESLVWEYMKPTYAKKGSKPKACFVSLVRNQELTAMLEAINEVEKKFNEKFHYPWVFMNDVQFTPEFKEEVSKAVSGKVEFTLIPKEHWSYPSYIDQVKAAEEREKMGRDGVVYGDSESYRHMCRFQSGFFWKQKELDKYDWYWRVEPGIRLHCDIDYDIFKWMQDNDKAYGFTISIHEYLRTIETLWDTVKEWWRENPQYIARNNLVEFISGDGGESYNLCHFWSNFEIANLNLWRSPAYKQFFQHLDETGNFFYERWGDAPVHSIAASLFLPKDKIHYFSDVGYFHIPYNNCPLDNNVFEKNKCKCNQEEDFTFHPYACGVQYYNAQRLEKPAGWEKFNNQ